MHPDAQIYLADQLALIRDDPPLRRERTPEEKAHTYSTFVMALQALKSVGAVDDAEVPEWSNRCLEALGEEPQPPIEPRPGRAIARIVRFGEAPPPEPVPRPLPEFRRLVPATTPAAVTRHGGRFQVLGVEIYDTELAVAWRLAPLPSDESLSRRHLAELNQDTEGLPDDVREVMRLGLIERRRMYSPMCEVTDDVGTDYRPMGGGSGGGGAERVGRTRYWPAPPQSARRLSVRWEDVVHDVPLN